MKILVRLPNWLGDMVMSVGFVRQLELLYPNASITLIAKKGIHELLGLFPPFANQFIFDKKEFKGVSGLWNFGRQVKSAGPFDLFFSLPDSFSSALIGLASGAKIRVGYKKELRQLLLTHSYSKPNHIHRAESYVRLLELYFAKTAGKVANTSSNVSHHVNSERRLSVNVMLFHSWKKQEHLVVNINSEASSRRLTVAKAIELLQLLRKTTNRKIVLIGAPKEKVFVEEVMLALSQHHNIVNLAGATSLIQLAEWLASAQVMISTDSGPAHLANALGTKTIVLFGAGNEHETAPYNELLRTIIRLNQLSCEPCQKNVCVRFAIPQCLERLDSHQIVNASISQ